MTRFPELLIDSASEEIGSNWTPVTGVDLKKKKFRITLKVRIFLRNLTKLCYYFGPFTQIFTQRI